MLEKHMRGLVIWPWLNKRERKSQEGLGLSAFSGTQRPHTTPRFFLLPFYSLPLSVFFFPSLFLSLSFHLCERFAVHTADGCSPPLSGLPPPPPQSVSLPPSPHLSPSPFKHSPLSHLLSGPSQPWHSALAAAAVATAQLAMEDAFSRTGSIGPM